ncbi:MAG: glycosyl hydrolase [Gammaproteobacteria bacterium]|nr:glycosyl hydrolase [Gammaproteobacteria bacterium]
MNSNEWRCAVFTWAAVTAVLIMAWPANAAAQTDAARIEAAIASLEWRNIGPTIMGGRVSDLAVVESDPATFYVGTATGGVWKTVNHGTTFESVFEDQPTQSVGDVTVAPSNPNVVWVGSGEPQNRQSSPWGNGVYRSTDAGRSWRHMGLEETHHISRIRVHPRDPNIVYVAAVGRLWGANPERGVYRTTDGGESWELVLFVDEDTGAIDLAMDPNDPETLFAAMYLLRRTGWGFTGGGPGSGIYRTTDGGASWVELTEGLPDGDMGRIGLDIFRGDGNLVFAIVEADKRTPGQGFGGGGGGSSQNGVYRSTDRGETWEQISTTNNRPMYYSQIWVDPTDPERIYTAGSSLFKSLDGGNNFTPDAASEVHPDHHAMWIDPANSDHIILGGDGGVSISWDRSDTWRQLTNLSLAQFYEIGVDMRDPYHVCGGLQDNGSWCGPSDTWSNQGIRTRDWYNVGGGDGFYTVMHPTNPRVMFSESQGGNLMRVDLVTMERTRMRPVRRPLEDGEDRDLRWNWDTPVRLSQHDETTVYVGSNVLFRSGDLGMTWEEISPDLTHAIDRSELEIMGVLGSEPQMSANDGQASYGNLETISESPFDAGLLYVGSDDGRVHVTRDGGGSWTDVTGNIPGLPERTYVSRVVASAHDQGTVYATFDGHRNNDFAAHVYVSDDYGESWRRIVDGLPATSVNVVAEHHRTAGLLIVGHELGVSFSVDGGEQWVALDNGLPAVPVDDIKIHPRENDLVLGTHGRGIYIMEDIAPLEGLTAEVLAANVHLFPVRRATSYNPYTPQGWTPGVYVSPNPAAGALIRYYLGEDLPAATQVAASSEENGDGDDGSSDASGQPKITILDEAGEVVRELTGAGAAGIQQVRWDLRIEPPYTPSGPPQQFGGGFGGGQARGPRVLPGTYTVRLEAAGVTQEEQVAVRLDPRVEMSRADLEARQAALMSAYDLAGPVYEAGQAVQRVTTQLMEVTALLREQEEGREDLSDEVSALLEEARELRGDINQAAAGARGAGAIESSSTRPTADQLWQLDQAWEKVPPLIERLNEIVTGEMPALYRRLDELGIRPDPGEAVTMPMRRRGG